MSRLLGAMGRAIGRLMAPHPDLQRLDERVLGPNLTGRKGRLLLCGFARWGLQAQPDHRLRDTLLDFVATTEDCVEGIGNRERWEDEATALCAAAIVGRLRLEESGTAGRAAVLLAQGAIGADVPGNDVVVVARRASSEDSKLWNEVCGDVLADQFPEVTRFDPAWSRADIRTIAQTMDDERSFDGMPVLADALEEVGCSNVHILNHCRQPGRHIRGCWVVDLVLGDE